MIETSRLIQFVLGDLDETEEDGVLEHLLGCDHCAQVVARLTDLGAAVRDLIESGQAHFVSTPSLIRSLEAAGLVTRHYRIQPGQSVACTVDAKDIYIATTVGGEIRGDARLDVITGPNRIRDVSFDPDTSSVTFITSADTLRPLPDVQINVQLLEVRDGEERVLGEYTMNHSAYRP